MLHIKLGDPGVKDPQRSHASLKVLEFYFTTTVGTRCDPGVNGRREVSWRHCQCLKTLRAMLQIWRQVAGRSISLLYGYVEPNENMSDIGFLKTDPNQTDLKIQKPKTQFLHFGFQKPTSAVWGRFFTLSHSQFIFQGDRINSQSIFLHAISLHF